MKDELFYDLQKSIKEGGKILKGQKKPSRKFISKVTSSRDKDGAAFPPLINRRITE
ncbi:MAG: hypothetical protein HYS25_11390 [Ignavibacteriales bacterium]|nr:hypothetical protein [Ignavibacteriales bacterium]